MQFSFHTKYLVHLLMKLLQIFKALLRIGRYGVTLSPCHPVIMSNEPDDNQDEVEPGFISYPMTCKEDQRKFELWVNCKDKQIWGRMGWYSYEHGWWADTFRPVEDKFTTLDSLYYNAGRTGGYSLFYVNYLAYVSHAVFQPIYQAICLSK